MPGTSSALVAPSCRLRPSAVLSMLSLRNVLEPIASAYAANPAFTPPHFIRTSAALHRVQLMENFYSSWSYDRNGHRVQLGMAAPWGGVGRHRTLGVFYDRTKGQIYSTIDGIPVQKCRTTLSRIYLGSARARSGRFVSIAGARPQSGARDHRRLRNPASAYIPRISRYSPTAATGVRATACYAACAKLVTSQASQRAVRQRACAAGWDTGFAATTDT